MLKITQGFLCYCSKGKLGLVLSKKKVKVGYPDGTSGMAYTGIHLGKDNFGTAWSSRNPHIAAYMDLNTGNIKIPSNASVVQLPN